MISGSLWSYFRDEMNDDANENNADNYKINNSNTITIKSFEYKTEIIRSKPNYSITLDTEVIVPSKYFSNFWRSLSFFLEIFLC